MKAGTTSADTRWIEAPGARHPILLVAGLIALGIVIGDRAELPQGFWMLLPFPLAGAALLLLWRRRLRLAAVFALALALASLGAWRIAAVSSGRPSPLLTGLIAPGRPVELMGRLADVPYPKGGGWRVPVDLNACRNTSGIVRLQTRVLLSACGSLAECRHGDRVRFRGILRAPFVRHNPGGFDYAGYLFRQGIDATVQPAGHLARVASTGRAISLSNLVEPVRVWIRQAFSTFPPRVQALMLGFLLGDTDRLPTDIYGAFRASGTLHLLAVSGANVWLVVGVFAWPLRKLWAPRWLRTIVLLALVVAFSFLTRNEPSVVRAAVMVSTVLIGRLFWYPSRPLDAVGAAGSIILLAAPAHLFHPGFQLSFAAVIGIIIAVRRCETLHLRGRWRRLRPLVMIVVASTAASLATAPILAWHFGTVPMMGFLSNVILVPLAGVVAHLGVVFLVLHACLPALASFLVWPTSVSVEAAIACARFFGGVPGTIVSWTDPSLLAMLHLYLGGALLLSWRYRYSWLRPAVYYAVLMFCLLTVRQRLSPEAPLGSLALPDAGNRRVAAIADGSGHVTWLADDPGIDEELLLWVVEPFARHRFGTAAPESWLPWIEAPAGPSAGRGAPVGASKSGVCRWRRYIAIPSDGSGMSRIVADVFAAPHDTVVMLREVPRRKSADILGRLTAELAPGSTVVVPMQVPISQVRAVIGKLQPRAVVLYGDNPFDRSRSRGELALWRLRYPGVRFYSTYVHGGLVIDFGSDSLRICPTVNDLTAFPDAG